MKPNIILVEDLESEYEQKLEKLRMLEIKLAEKKQQKIKEKEKEKLKLMEESQYLIKKVK